MRLLCNSFHISKLLRCFYPLKRRTRRNSYKRDFVITIQLPLKMKWFSIFSLSDKKSQERYFLSNTFLYLARRETYTSPFTSIFIISFFFLQEKVAYSFHFLDSFPVFLEHICYSYKVQISQMNNSLTPRLQERKEEKNKFFFFLQPTHTQFWN